MLTSYKQEIIIDRRSNEPVYLQVYLQLEDLLTSARVIDQQAIIKAKDLAKELNVDHSQVKEAYDLLEQHNFIAIDDLGTPRVIKYSRILNFFSKLILIEDGIRSLGKEPSIELMSLNIVKIESNELVPISEFNDQRFLRQRRLFKADEEPYFYLEEFYPIERFPKLLSLEKDMIGKIYSHILKKEYNIDFVKNKRKINVISFNKELSEILQIKEGRKGFKIDLIYYDQDGIPFGYGHAYSLPQFYFEFNNMII